MATRFAAVSAPENALETRYRTVDVDGLVIFYREAGPASAAASVVLLSPRVSDVVSDVPKSHSYTG